MKRCAWSALAVLVVASGCSEQMVGTWRTVKVDPACSEKNFDMKCITFNKDGTYKGMVKQNDEVKAVTGKWAYNGTKLTLTTPEGRSHEYDAAVTMGGELKVSHKVCAGEKVTVDMKKVTCGKTCCCPKCPMACKDKKVTAKCPMAEKDAAKCPMADKDKKDAAKCPVAEKEKKEKAKECEKAKKGEKKAPETK